MGPRGDAAAWAEIVKGLAAERDLRYEPVGGINPKGAPQALCPGGTNRITGRITEEFWGASCDAAEERVGGVLRGAAILPRSVLAKAHMPDLAEVLPAFNAESMRDAEDAIRRRIGRRVEFESIEFNRRFIATAPSDYDPVALRELFGPGLIDWAARIPSEVDFGITDRQLYFKWRLRERSRAELEAALENAGQLFKRVRWEMDESGVATYPAGPWHAGLDPFPES